MEPFYYTRMTKAQQAAYHVIMQGALYRSICLTKIKSGSTRRQ